MNGVMSIVIICAYVAKQVLQQNEDIFFINRETSVRKSINHRRISQIPCSCPLLVNNPQYNHEDDWLNDHKNPDIEFFVRHV